MGTPTMTPQGSAGWRLGQEQEVDSASEAGRRVSQEPMKLAAISTDLAENFLGDWKKGIGRAHPFLRSNQTAPLCRRETRGSNQHSPK